MRFLATAFMGTGSERVEDELHAEFPTARIARLDRDTVTGKRQFEDILHNFREVVEAAGGKMQDITKLNIFVRDRDDYLAHLKQLGQAHRSFFGAYYPAMALFEISRFFQDEALIEIEGIAVVDN